MTTIKDIAKKANVSPTTVSRILNQDPSFNPSEETRQKIFSIAKELNYKTVSERYSPKNYRLALVYKPEIFENSLKHDFHYSIRSGIEQACARFGIDLINVFNFSGGFASEKLNGAIIIGNYSNNEIESIAAALTTENIVIIGRCPDDNRFDSIWFDTERAVYSALKHLTDNGHQDIGYIGAFENADIPHEHRRDQIFLRYMSKYSSLKTSRVYIGEHGPQSGYKLMKQAYEEGSLPTAIFFANDPLAIGALEFFKEANIRVPDELSIVSFDGHHLVQFTAPPLTTVSVPKEFMGRMAVHSVIELIDQVRTIRMKKWVPTDLIVRESCRNIQN